MEPKKTTLAYRILKGLIRLFSPRMTLEGQENLPDRPALIVANHCQLYGPIAAELYFPRPCRTWCAAQMMEWKEVPAYAFEDFWSQKPRWQQPFFKLLSYLITPFSVCVFNNADTIPVRRDMRIVSTFKETLACMQQGANIVVFPEEDRRHNAIIYNFQEHFIDFARLYRKRTGEELLFVPMYISPKLGRMVLGKPIAYDSAADTETERERVRTALMDAVTALGRSLPEHTVVPYRNIRKRDYPRNTSLEEYPLEEARR